jgi:MOSC domain-containing protein YiiM
VCLYSVELYHDLITERILVKPGDFGENLTTSGIDYRALHVGDRMRVGEGCLLEITKVRVPCYKLTKFDERLPKAILGRSGWMARVRTEGVVRAGDSIDVLPAAVAEE